MARGEHLVLRRNGYTHHGIDVGNGDVIHFNGSPFRRSSTAKIEVCSLAEFSGDSSLTVIPHETNPDIVIQRAKSKVGQSRYNLLTNNCEHFARWCVEGEPRSPQVKQAAVIAAVAALTGIVFAVAPKTRRK